MLRKGRLVFRTDRVPRGCVPFENQVRLGVLVIRGSPCRKKPDNVHPNPTVNALLLAIPRKTKYLRHEEREIQKHNGQRTSLTRNMI